MLALVQHPLQRLALLGTLALAACQGRCQPSAEALSPGKSPTQRDGFHVEHLEFSVGEFHGLSGVDNDGDEVWAVPERQHTLLSLSIDPPSLRATLPIVGVPKGFELEALAMLPPTSTEPRRLVLGTESQKTNRQGDSLFWGHIQDGAVHIHEQTILSYELWSMTAERNRGIEGLCYSNGQDGHPGYVVAAVETYKKTAGERWSPLGVLDLQSQQWTALRAGLVGKKAKLSSLSCAPSSTAAEILVTAIARHYGEAYLLRYALPFSLLADGAASAPRLIAPKTLIDLSDLIGGNLNLEGIAALPNGRWLLLGDNHTGRITGPTAALLLTPTKEN